MTKTFTNEIGNEITIGVNHTDVGTVLVKIEGPTSTFECELTKMEGNELKNELEEFFW